MLTFVYSELIQFATIALTFAKIGNQRGLERNKSHVQPIPCIKSKGMLGPIIIANVKTKAENWIIGINSLMLYKS